ncbi:MAG TPA: thiamine pyrophosphate-dependent dehydrogenase E1 component subunit alpha [Vicinamibacterales bacterium]|jgi:pyruvate dehydrogenase E1 component alpha subunit|nr:thiamine pyrophosphate-dependent dehydrogenase E1 component subunit alpha [Vicinamibacterales bacterium]
MAHYSYAGRGAAGIDTLASSRTPQDLTALFRSMLRIRRIEEEIERRYHEDQMKTPIHLVIGQEATSVGCCAALRDTDLLYSSHRTHGNYLAKGGDLRRMLCEMHCRINGCAGSRGGSMHLIDKAVGMAGTSAIVGGAVPIATGAALAAKIKGDDRVVVVFLGDATTEEGVTSESLNFAALKELPIVFFCENNFYSVQSPLATRQPPTRDLAEWAASHRVTSVKVDGVNVLEVQDATAAAVARARKGGGPTFIEAPVYRFRAHGGAGDDSRTGYRQVTEREAWEQVDPVTLFKDVLARRGALTDSTISSMETAIAQEIDEAFRFALASPNPVESDLYQFVYAD